MKAYIKRHKTLTAFVMSLVVVVILEGMLSRRAGADVGGVAELMGLGWTIYGFAWLIWGYPKWRKRKAKAAEELKE